MGRLYGSASETGKTSGKLAGRWSERFQNAETKAGKNAMPFAGPKKIKENILSGRLLNVGRLRTLRSLNNFEFDHVSLLQCAVAVSDDGGIVDEHIRAIVAPDKAITLCVIEPFHGATQA
jgi:hypothetical protein